MLRRSQGEALDVEEGRGLGALLGVELGVGPDDCGGCVVGVAVAVGVGLPVGDGDGVGSPDEG